MIYIPMGETVDPQGLDNRTKYYPTETLRFQKPRPRKSHICKVLGESCPYMKRKDGQIFRNYAELKEDALRHMRALQCFRCRKTFGKPYALKRHKRDTKRCKKPGGTATKPPKISPRLARAIKMLKKAKKEDVYAAIELCMECNEIESQQSLAEDSDTEMLSDSEDNSEVSDSEDNSEDTLVDNSPSDYGPNPSMSAIPTIPNSQPGEFNLHDGPFGGTLVNHSRDVPLGYGSDGPNPSMSAIPITLNSQPGEFNLHGGSSDGTLVNNSCDVPPGYGSDGPNLSISAIPTTSSQPGESDYYYWPSDYVLQDPSSSISAQPYGIQLDPPIVDDNFNIHPGVLHGPNPNIPDALMVLPNFGPASHLDSILIGNNMDTGSPPHTAIGTRCSFSKTDPSGLSQSESHEPFASSAGRLADSYRKGIRREMQNGLKYPALKIDSKL